MASSEIKTRKQKLEAWKSCERMAESWLNYLATVPANTTMSDKEWFAGWRNFQSKQANAPRAAAV